MILYKEFEEFIKGKKDISQEFKNELIEWLRKGQEDAYERGHKQGCMDAKGGNENESNTR
jgi:hypothetical protein